MQYTSQCLWNRTTNQRWRWWRWWRWWWWYHDILLHFRTHVVFGSFSSCIFAIASRSRSRSTRHTNHPPSPNTTKKKKKTRSSFGMFLLSSHNNTPDKTVSWQFTPTTRREIRAGKTLWYESCLGRVYNGWTCPARFSCPVVLPRRRCVAQWERHDTVVLL